MMKLILVAGVLLAGALGVALAMANPTPVTVDLLFAQWTAPLIWILALEFVVVVLLCAVVLQIRSAIYRRRINRLQKQLDAAEAELNNLRSLPLSEV